MGVASEIFIHTPKERKHITGEPITGIVKFHLDQDTVYKNIALSLVERGQCQWQANRDTLIQTVEEIVVEKMYLLDNNTDGNIPLSAGTHEHPFVIVIPENVPPTVKTSVGEIKYHLVLKFKRLELLRWNKTFKTKIIIYPRIDFSLSDQRIISKLDKTLFKPFSSKNHEINLETVLDKEYLTPCGSRNIISFAVNNKSDVIFSIKTELLCKTKYTIPKHNKSVSKKKVISFSTVETPNIPDNSVSNMSNTIPVAQEIYTVRHSNIINREYKLRVTLKLPMPHVNSSVEIPVFVGESVEVNGGEAGISSEPMEDPPSYWEAMQEVKEKDD